MNTIERLWDQIVVHIRDMDNTPTTAAQLRVAVKQAWVALRSVRLMTWVQSMPRQMSAILAVRGGTPTVNEPPTMPLIPSTDLQKLKIANVSSFCYKHSLIILQWHPLTPLYIACIRQKITLTGIVIPKLITFGVDNHFFLSLCMAS